MMKQKIYLCKSKVNREKLDIRDKIKLKSLTKLKNRKYAVISDRNELYFTSNIDLYIVKIFTKNIFAKS